MSLISRFTSKLHRSTPAGAGEAQTEQEEISDLSSAPALDRGMPIEVMNDFDTPLFFGRLAADSPAGLTILRIPGEKSFPVCQIGSSVLLRGYDARMNPILLLGRVVRSSWTQCMMEDLKRISYKTQRKRARCPLTPPVSVCALDAAAPDRPQVCQMLNISAGGACIVAKRLYQVKQPLRLLVELAQNIGHTAVYRCQVIRATPRGGGYFEYGLLFTQMDEKRRSTLMRDIQAIHRETEEKLLF